MHVCVCLCVWSVCAHKGVWRVGRQLSGPAAADDSVSPAGFVAVNILKAFLALKYFSLN